MEGDSYLLKNVFLWVMFIFVLPMLVISAGGFLSINRLNQSVEASFNRVRTVYEEGALDRYRSGVQDIGRHVEKSVQQNIKTVNHDKSLKYSAFLKNVVYHAEFAHGMITQDVGCEEEYNDSFLFNVSNFSSEKASELACYSNLIRRMDMTNPGINLIYVVDSDGNMVVSKDIKPNFSEGSDPVKKHWLDEAGSDESFWVEPYTEKYTGSLVTTFVRPVKIYGGQQGYIGMDFLVEDFRDEMDSMNSSIGFLMKGSGELLFCSDSDKASLCSGISEICAEMKEGEVFRRNVEGSMYYVYHRPLEVNEWEMGMAVQEEEMMSPVTGLISEMEQRRRVVTGMVREIRESMMSQLSFVRVFVFSTLFFMVIVVVFTLYFFYDMVLKPVQVIKERADSISRGNDMEEIKVDAQGEISELAEAFNRMLRSMKLMSNGFENEEGMEGER